MASFTVRVELHDADASDYAKLDETMKEEGFERWMVGTDGAKHRLPTGEYHIDSTLQLETIMDHAGEAADSVKPDPPPAIVITEAVRRGCSGLKVWAKH
jgi:hypothetical protein